jgi:hypothetical protein
MVAVVLAAPVGFDGWDVVDAPEHTSPSLVKIARFPTTTPARWSIDTRPPDIAI